MRRLCTIAQPLVVALAALLRFGNNRQLMLSTDKIAQPCDGFGGIPKVSEFSCAVERGGVPVNMIRVRMVLLLSGVPFAYIL